MSDGTEAVLVLYTAFFPGGIISEALCLCRLYNPATMSPRAVWVILNLGLLFWVLVHGQTTQTTKIRSTTTESRSPPEQRNKHTEFMENMWRSKKFEMESSNFKIPNNYPSDPLANQMGYQFLNCDIDNLVGFTDLKRDFSWKVTSGNSVSRNIYQPSSDHTYGTPAGKYLYADVTGRGNGSGAAMALALSPPSGETHICAEFSYISYGISIGSYGLLISQGGNVRSLWVDNGSKGSVWITRTITIKINMTQSFLLGFSIIQLSSDGDGGLAVDDFKLQTGACGVPAGISSTAPPTLTWEPWSYCSDTCGPGFRIRLRNCTGSGFAWRQRIQTGACTERPCGPGSCGSWTSWSACSTTCGSGSKSRARKRCPRISNTELCNTQSCPFWLAWQSWSSCSVTCGEGVVTRSRSCRGIGCEGHTNEKESCVRRHCNEAACTSGLLSLNKASGNISSPGYLIGENYPNGASCQWRITAPTSDDTILLTVIAFKTHSPKDTFRIMNGNTANTEAIITDLNGEVLPGRQYRSSKPSMFLQFWSDTHGTDTGFLFTYEASVPPCPVDIVTLTSSSGNITSPGYREGRNYPNALYCRWRIIAQNIQMLILVTITSLKTEPPLDKLRLMNGNSINHHKTIKDLSSEVIPGTQYRSSEPAMFLEFWTDSYGTERGFSINYEAFVPPCPFAVVTLTNSSGNITSPGYLERRNYPNALNCKWRIMAQNSQMTILVTIMSFKTGPSLDKLRLMNGNAINYQKIITDLNGEVIPGTQYRSSEPAMFLEFYTDSYGTDRGFSINYEAFVSPCPFAVVTLTNSSGNITSPGYLERRNYPNALNCKWRIMAQNSQMTILVTIMSFKTGPSLDKLRLMNGNAINYQKIITDLNGEVIPGTQYRSSEPAMFLEFYTDSYGTDRGFSINYEAFVSPCPFAVVTLTNSSGNITSPGYLERRNYPNALNCKWRIMAQNSQMTILVTIMSFKTGPSLDKLRLMNGNAINYQKIITDLNGEVIPGTQYRSSEPAMFLEFYTDSYGTDRGFSINYEAFVSPCPFAVVTLTNSSGNITSPGYLERRNYPNALHCKWRIMAQNIQMTILVTIMSFKTGPSLDKLRLMNGNAINYQKIITDLNGEVIPGTQYRSSEPAMFLEFYTDSYWTDRGFSINYQAFVPQCSIAVVTLTNSTGNITSPGYLEGRNYPNALHCKWRIMAQNSQMTILVTIMSFKTGPSLDKLRLMNGNAINYQKIITDLNGEVIPGTQYRSSEPAMFLEFHTDSYGTDRGFSINYKAFVPPCPFAVVTLTNSSGNITSPGYLERRNYPNALHCKWRIMAQNSQLTILVTIMSFKTGPSLDKLRLMNGNAINYQKIITDLNGEVIPGTQYRSSEPAMFLEFYTDSYWTDRGFSINYEAFVPPCPFAVVTLTNSSGNITSPGYLEGRNYPNALHCKWRIMAQNSQMTILVTIMSFKTGPSLDKLRLMNGNAINYHKIIKDLNGEVLPGTQYRSSEPAMFLEFYTDSYGTESSSM